MTSGPPNGDPSRYCKYYVSCYTGSYYDYGSYETYYEVRPISFAGGGQSRQASPPTATYCRPFENGMGFTKSSSNSITWTNGVDLSPSIGVDMSSRTGYSSTAKVVYTFTGNRALCGRGGYPAETAAYLLVAKTSA